MVIPLYVWSLQRSCVWGRVCDRKGLHRKETVFIINMQGKRVNGEQEERMCKGKIVTDIRASKERKEGWKPTDQTEKENKELTDETEGRKNYKLEKINQK